MRCKAFYIFYLFLYTGVKTEDLTNGISRSETVLNGEKVIQYTIPVTVPTGKQTEEGLEYKPHPIAWVVERNINNPEIGGKFEKHTRRDINNNEIAHYTCGEEVMAEILGRTQTNLTKGNSLGDINISSHAVGTGKKIENKDVTIGLRVHAQVISYD